MTCGVDCCSAARGRVAQKSLYLSPRSRVCLRGRWLAAHAPVGFANGGGGLRRQQRWRVRLRSSLHATAMVAAHRRRWRTGAGAASPPQARERGIVRFTQDA